MSGELDFQREVAKAALSAIGSDGFALAGSGAIREHGITQRPTEDVDLFIARRDQRTFDRSVERAASDLRERGYLVELTRRSDEFARLRVTAADGSHSADLDLGVDWRDREPAVLEVGPVLNLVDAVGGKLSAVYSRGEARLT